MQFESLLQIESMHRLLYHPPMPLNEADTRAKLIDPAIHIRWCTEDHCVHLCKVIERDSKNATY